MAASEFSVHLGGSLYTDSNGVLAHGAIARAFQGLARALPDKEDPIVGAALAVMTVLLELLKEGPTSLELMITRRLDDLERNVKALEVQIQPRASHWLFTFPTGRVPRRVTLPAQGANGFDHRLMVPLTTRQNRSLCDFAFALTTLLENMRGEGLGRTIYTGTNSNDGAGGGARWRFAPEKVIDLDIFGVPPHLAPGNARLAVRALDLRSHHDADCTAQFIAGPIQFAESAKQGPVDVRWTPPATAAEVLNGS